MKYTVMSDPRRGEMKDIGEIEVADDGAVTITNSGELDGYFLKDSKTEPYDILRRHYPYVFKATEKDISGE